jgi:hypothetical protein
LASSLSGKTFGFETVVMIERKLRREGGDVGARRPMIGHLKNGAAVKAELFSL